MALWDRDLASFPGFAQALSSDTRVSVCRATSKGYTKERELPRSESGAGRSALVDGEDVVAGDHWRFLALESGLPCETRGKKRAVFALDWPSARGRGRKRRRSLVCDMPARAAGRVAAEALPFPKSWRRP